MSRVVVVSDAPIEEVAPSLPLLPFHVQRVDRSLSAAVGVLGGVGSDARTPGGPARGAGAPAGPRGEALPDGGAARLGAAPAVLLLDARSDLVVVRSLSRSLAEALPQAPIVAVMTEGGLSAVSPDWGLADVVLPDAGPAELHARLRLARPTREEPEQAPPPVPAAGDLVIDVSGYSARIKGHPLDLTYKEFELLRCLVDAAGRVLTREQILDDVWGRDYYGGTRTVDVHIRRLRAKLGPENESLIGTVRNVGYRYTEA